MASTHRTRIILFVLIILMGAFFKGFLTQTSAENSFFWHAFKGNTGHTGYINQVSERKLSLHWRYFFRGDYANPLQVVNNRIYFLDRSGFVCCVDRKDGSEIFRVLADEKRLVLGMDVSREAIVVCTGPIFTRRGVEEISCVVYAFSTSTGEKIWQKKIEVIMVTPPVIADNKVWIASGKLDPTFSKTAGGDLLCLDVNDGEEILRTETEDYAFYGNYLTMEEGVILAQGLKYDSRARSQMPPRLFAFSEKTGSPLWEQDPLDETRMFGTPSIKKGLVYLTENPGFFGFSRRKPEAWLIKLDLHTGKMLKTMNIPDETFGNFSPTLANDAIYINSFTGKIYAIDYEMDRIYWTKRLDRFSYFTELTSTKNYLYTCLYDGDLIAVSKEDGNVVFRYRIGNYGGIPVVVDEQVLVTGDVLYCFSSNAEPILYTEPTHLYFDVLHLGETKQLSFRIIYTGSDKINGTIRCSEPWLQIRPDSVTSPIQTCFVTLDSSKAPSGKINANIVIETNHGSKTIPVEAEIIPPAPLPLEINIKEEGLLTNQKSFMILGLTEPLTKVYINDWFVYADENGRYSHVVTLKEGKNYFQVQAVSKDNRKAALSRTIELDSIPPDLLIESFEPIPDSLRFRVRGSTEITAKIEILDETYEVDSNGHFDITFTAENPIPDIVVSAIDLAGNITTQKINGMVPSNHFFSYTPLGKSSWSR